MIIAKPQNLYKLMAKKGFTGNRLAEKTGITQGYMSYIIRGRRAVLPPTAKKICDALQCDFDEIFEIREEKVWKS